MNQKVSPPLPVQRNRTLLRFISTAAALTLAVLLALAWAYKNRSERKTRDEMQRGAQPTYHAFSYVARKADARGRGYDLGYKFGRLTAISGKPVPSDESLQAAVLQMASDTNAIPAADKKKFAEAFRSGFARGYRDAGTPAL